jgi:hypothetical protein
MDGLVIHRRSMPHCEGFGNSLACLASVRGRPRKFCHSVWLLLAG